jgi:hypothetical protein
MAMTTAIKSAGSRAVWTGAAVYGSFFGAYGLYSYAVGVSEWWWPLAEWAIAAVFGAYAFWRVQGGASARQTVLVTAFAHFAVRLGPILVSSWNDEGIPHAVLAVGVGATFLVMALWLLVSLVVVRFATRRAQ